MQFDWLAINVDHGNSVEFFDEHTKQHIHFVCLHFATALFDCELSNDDGNNLKTANGATQLLITDYLILTDKIIY